MPTDKLSFGLVIQETSVIGLLLHRLLLLRYIFVVSHFARTNLFMRGGWFCHLLLAFLFFLKRQCR